MKKLSVMLIVFTLFFGFAANDVFAKAIGIKGGYTTFRNDWDVYDEDWDFGIYFDMGTFLISNLDFRPSIDKVSLEISDQNVKYKDVWGIHLDWYWHFMDKGSIAPFIGFGPSLNYNSFDDSRDDNDDSDAGVDVFLGLDVKISGTPLSLMVEGRYKFFDIAARSENAIQLNVGLAYNF